MSDQKQDPPAKFAGFSLAGSKTASLSSASSSKKRDAPTGGDKDYVTGFFGNELTSVTPAAKPRGDYVIPLHLQSQTKRSKTTSSDSDTPVDRAQADKINNNNNNNNNNVSSSSTEPKTLDQIAAEEIIKDLQAGERIDESILRSVPLTMQHQIDGIETITDEKERFKFDVDSRPEEATEQEYDDMPIEEFGTAMLRGMGWTPGKALGLTGNGLVEPIEFVKRAGFRLGLGATPKDVEQKKKKYIKPGESREPPPIMVVAPDADGKVRHYKGVGEKLVPLKKGLQPGQVVGIVSGEHEGVYARIVKLVPNYERPEEEEVIVRLVGSDENVVVSKSDVSVVDPAKLSKDHPAFQAEGEGKKKEKSKKDSSKNDPMWLQPRIMVRIVSKSFNNGKFYCKKGNIFDVTGDKRCTVQLEDGKLVEDVKQRMLETVIPKPGGKVMVVIGSQKGRIGTFLEKKKSDKDGDIAVVQVAPDLSIHSFPLDNVCQYIGGVEEDYL